MKCAISQKMSHDSETDSTPHIIKKIVFKTLYGFGLKEEADCRMSIKKSFFQAIGFGYASVF